MDRIIRILLAGTLALSCPAIAFADEEAGDVSTAVAEESESFKILTGETEIEQLTDTYEEARSYLEAVDAEIAELQEQIDGIEEQLPELQARSDAGIMQRYIMQSNPLVIVESLLSAGTLGDFLKQSDYLEKISKENLKAYNQLRDMQKQLDQTRAEQEKLREAADARLADAEAALRAVQDERAARQAEDQEFAARQAEMQGGPNSIEKEEDESSSDNGKKKSKKEKEAEEAEKAKKAEEDAAKGILPPVEATMDTEGLADGADWYADRDAFIEDWAGRIDAYLEGSALEGQGYNFAAAAWKYGIDPRWSPAISNTESSKGAVCIRPHNAWGWGAADSDPYGLASEWGSWEEAIDAHVKGLAEGYGYTISMGRARTYCPPNWQRWYNNVLGDMATMTGSDAPAYDEEA